MERRSFLKVGAVAGGSLLVPVFGNAIAAEELLNPMAVQLIRDELKSSYSWKCRCSQKFDAQWVPIHRKSFENLEGENRCDLREHRECGCDSRGGAVGVHNHQRFQF